LDDVVDLIYARAILAAPIHPLRAVDAAEIAIFVRPFIPDRDAMFTQKTYVRLAAQEPEQLVNDRFKMELLRGEERKIFPQIEPRLRAENGNRPDARAIRARLAALEHQAEEIVVFAHAFAFI